MAQEPQWEIQEKWVDCERSWTKINQGMRDIGLPEFGSPEDFVDLHDIVKQHAEQDSSWTAEIEKVENMVPGQVQQFMEHPIKARTILHVRKIGPRSNKIKQMRKQNTEDTQYKRDTDLRGSPSVGYVHQRNCQVLPLLLSSK
jgi:hypothetical protein